jgi:hypothetical protein
MKWPYGTLLNFAMLRSHGFEGRFTMKNDINYGELRKLLLELGFSESVVKEGIVFRHEPSDTMFVFRLYRPTDAVASYNLIEVKSMLDARGLMTAETFDDQFRKTPV